LPYLFSYGSNHPDQLADRLDREVRSEAAYLPAYGRVFRGWSRGWGGGVASLERDRGRDVYGLVVPVSQADLRLLDSYEGVGSGNYKRKKVKVVLDSGDEVGAVAYVSTSDEYNPPTKDYLRAVVKTINTHWSSQGGSKVQTGDIALRGAGTPQERRVFMWDEVFDSDLGRVAPSRTRTKFGPVIRDRKGWSRRAPKLRTDREMTAEVCGRARCFLVPKTLGYPICVKVPAKGRRAPKAPGCAIDCSGLQAAYTAARGGRGARKRPQVAKRAVFIAKKAKCDWARNH